MTVLPVFPLPDTVFFPATNLPLHIFESRYRQLIADVTDGDGRFVVSLMDGDDFHAVATMGVIRELNPIPDGRSTLVLEGEARVELTEMPSPHPYRLVRAVARPEAGPEPSEQLERARVDLVASMSLLTGEMRSPDETPFAVALNTVCSTLPIEAGFRQQLLEEDSLLRRHAMAIAHLDAVIETVMRVRNEDGDTPDPHELN